MTCKRASGFLEANQIEVLETVSASKKLQRGDAVSMARRAQRVIAAKGKKVTRVDLAGDQPSDDDLSALMLGPTGNLRAPTMRVGKTILVGYNEEVFTAELT